MAGLVVAKITRDNEFIAGIRTRRTGHSFCTGSLIASNFVLTAAHCAINQSIAWVTIGAPKTDGKSGEIIQVRRAIPHSKYNVSQPFPKSCDIMLLELEDASRRTPIRLGTDSTADLLGKSGTGFGYGTMYSAGNSSADLRSVKATFGPPNGECAEIQHHSKSDDSTICFQSPAGSGTCSGDSGGPVVLDASTASQRVVGIFGGVMQLDNGTCNLSLPGWCLHVGAAMDFIRSTLEAAEKLHTRRPYNSKPTHPQE